MKLSIDSHLHLELFTPENSDLLHLEIQKIENTDDLYESNLVNKYSDSEKLREHALDAYENKFCVDGTPDFLIFESGRAVGMFEFHPLSGDDHIEIGYWLFKFARRKKIISRVIPAMIDFAFENFRKSKVYATTPVENVASQKLLESLGFERGKVLTFDRQDNSSSREVEFFFDRKSWAQ